MTVLVLASVATLAGCHLRHTARPETSCGVLVPYENATSVPALHAAEGMAEANTHNSLKVPALPESAVPATPPRRSRICLDQPPRFYADKPVTRPKTIRPDLPAAGPAPAAPAAAPQAPAAAPATPPSSADGPTPNRAPEAAPAPAATPAPAPAVAPAVTSPATPPASAPPATPATPPATPPENPQAPPAAPGPAGR